MQMIYKIGKIRAFLRYTQIVYFVFWGGVLEKIKTSFVGTMANQRTFSLFFFLNFIEIFWIQMTHKSTSFFLFSF